MKFIEQFIFNILQNGYKRALVLLLTLLAFIGSVLMLPYKIVLAKMLPGKDSNTFSVYVDLPEGRSIKETKEVTDCVVKVLSQSPYVLDIEVFLGRGGPLDFAGLIKNSGMKNSENLAEIVVNIPKKHDRDKASYTLVHEIRPEIQKRCQTPQNGANIKLIEPPAGPPTLSAIVAEIYGGSFEGRERLAKKIEAIFKQIDGLVDIDILSDESYKKYELVPNSVKISKAGLTVEHVNQILYMSFEGVELAVKNDKNAITQVPIFVRLSDDTKNISSNSLETLKNKLTELKLMNEKGLLVPLSELVDIKEINSSKTIKSKNLREYIQVVAETDMVSQVYPLLEARDKIREQLKDEYEIDDSPFLHFFIKDKKSGEHYELRWDGEMKVTIDTFIDLGGAFIAALILIFLLMVVYYKSFALSGIVLLGSFLSIIGVIVGHWIMDIFMKETFYLTATSLIGYIALIGISSRNSLLLIDFTKLLLAKGIEKDRAIAIATATRAKPIFLTAGAIILASSLLASDAVFGGLGVSLIFGTIAAVIASLVTVPVLLKSAEIKYC